jgi:co-chaperonin GroES (HSP10)
MSLKFRPTKDRILVEPVEAAATIGAITIPTNAREEKPAEAVVMALGPLTSLPLRIGDRVVTQRYNGTDVMISGRRFRLLEPEDVIAVVSENLND